MSFPRFHDAHAHAVQAQDGGFLIALDGKPELPGTLRTPEVLAWTDRSRGRIGVPYACAGGADSGLEGPIMKYHPRREGFTAEWVANDIHRYGRRLVLIDTLNAIPWPPRSYIDIAVRFPGTQFVMCHAGGYDALEFVKACRFMKNVWIDFSATQHIFGWAQRKPNLRPICDLIDHALREPRIAARLMFGSDNPEFPQVDAIETLVATVADPEPMLVSNFERLLEVAGI